ncbi:MAG: 5-(carboxyamino)imidazole ribonucleotide synthase [Elusimicrobiota bacterium]
MNQIIYPGSQLGILGSGQLGRMFAMAARQMGYHIHTFSPEKNSPMGQVSDVEWIYPYENLDAVKNFSSAVQVIGFEFENVPSATAEAAAAYCPLRPGAHVLHTTQQRLREKRFLEMHHFPVTVFASIQNRNDLESAAEKVKFPAVIKTADFGYDGKGQIKVHNFEELKNAFTNLQEKESILEAWVSFDRELSVVGARSLNGEYVDFGVFENEHTNHILDSTTWPASLSESVVKEAREIARGIFSALDVVGVLCVEMFLTKEGKILVNELAPRPHNSGHLTIEACSTSQFEQQVRAICGLPLGKTEIKKPAAMANLLGDLWLKGNPKWDQALKIPNVKLHLYGKSNPQKGRKMGHLTALADTVTQAKELVLKARAALHS